MPKTLRLLLYRLYLCSKWSVVAMLCPCLPRHRHLFSQNDLCCFDYNEHKQAESTDYGQVVDRWYDDAECLTHSRDLNQDSIYLQGYLLKWELILYEISNARHMRSFDHKVELMYPNMSS